MPATEPDPRRTKVTVIDVARLAGVSPMTVSRALNKPEAMPHATVQRVQDAVAKLGYVRNLMAGGLRSQRSNLVAAVFPSLAGPVFLECIDALNTNLLQRGYHLIVCQGGYGATNEDELLADVLGRRPDAIVVTGTSRSSASQRLLLSAGIPVLEIWDLSSDPIDMLIGFSHEAIGGAVAKFFAGTGRRRLALIGGEDERSRRRWQSFRDRAVDLGLPTPMARFVPAPARLGYGRTALRELLAEAPEIDGVFCSSDMMAMGVLIEARALGRTVPGDLGVVGFGDLNFAADLEPALTTVRVSATRIGQLAAETLAQRLQGVTPPERLIDVGFEVVRRASA